MTEQELFYILALQKVKRVGDITAKKLLKHFGSAELIFQAAQKNQMDIPNIGSLVSKYINSFNDWKRIEHEIKYIEQNLLEVVTIFDQKYPDKLFHAPDGPILYFQKGRAVFSVILILNIFEVTLHNLV